jgi:cytoskeletal protein CcmA (bactofilin family)
MFRRRKPEDGPEPPASGPQPLSPAADNGLGVPPFRPAPKEPPAMSRPPLPNVPPAGPSPVVRPPVQQPRAGRDPAERRTLVVGRGISVHGTVQDAERLVVEGTIEASMIHATELVIPQGGVFKGEVEVEDAEVSGTMDGTVTARGSLRVSATGKVLGTARCRRLTVEDGGQITGSIQMITGEANPPKPPAPAAVPAAPVADPAA